MNTAVDQRALKVLFGTYWSPAGWRNDAERKTSPTDLAYAKTAGLMFDAARLNHEQALALLFSSMQKLTKRAVADAFLASLSSRRLEWRSALGSYAVFQHVPSHEPSESERQCGVCGFYLRDLEQDLNVLNFERFKWGGVRHTKLEYAAMDLSLFLKNPSPQAGASDIQIFRGVLSAITAASPEVTSAELQSHLAKVLKSNKAEREVVISILGFCGILETPSHLSFSGNFVPVGARDLPDRRFVDMPYPACWWKAGFGLNAARLQEYFGHVL